MLCPKKSVSYSSAAVSYGSAAVSRLGRRVFAALPPGCEARLCLADNKVRRNRAAPVVRPMAYKHSGKAQTKGIAFKLNHVNGEAKPRLTSGGGAVRSAAEL